MEDVNINKFQDFNMPHTHPESFIMELFIFQNVMKVILFLKILVMELLALKGLYRKPKNRLVLFPAWLKHGVAPNPSKTHKYVSFSFNIQLNYLPDRCKAITR